MMVSQKQYFENQVVIVRLASKRGKMARISAAN